MAPRLVPGAPRCARLSPRPQTRAAPDARCCVKWHGRPRKNAPMSQAQGVSPHRALCFDFQTFLLELFVSRTVSARKVSARGPSYVSDTAVWPAHCAFSHAKNALHDPSLRYSCHARSRERNGWPITTLRCNRFNRDPINRSRFCAIISVVISVSVPTPESSETHFYLDNIKTGLCEY